MKTLKLTGKLSLNKETIAKLNEKQLAKVNGGVCTLAGSGCTGSGTKYTNSPTRIDCCL